MRIPFLMLLSIAAAARVVDVAAAPLPQKPVLTLEAAKEVAAAAGKLARQANAPGAAIAIVDDGGTAVYLERLDHTFPHASAVSLGKARTAALFRKPSQGFEDAVNGARPALLGVEGLTPLMGGVPIEIDGHVVGAIGVSGAASAQQDTDIATAGAAAAKARYSNR